jgi:hypothetical protein
MVIVVTANNTATAMIAITIEAAVNCPKIERLRLRDGDLR